MSIFNFPIILTFCYIANLFECMAMFYFVKRLAALRIITEPCTDRTLLFSCFSVLLHDALDVGSFGRGKERLVPLRTEMDNCIYGSPENLACLVEYIRKQAWICLLAFSVLCSKRMVLSFSAVAWFTAWRICCCSLACCS